MSGLKGQDSTYIPVIDISTADEQTGHDLVDAVVQSGFVFIKSKGLGVDAQTINRMFEISCAFFESPQEDKERCKMHTNNRGWTRMGEEVLDEKLGDPKEGFNFGEFVNGEAQQPLTPSLQAHEAECSHFADLCRSLCLRLLELFAVGLNIDPLQGGSSWFSSRHDASKGPSGTILRLLYYPALPSSSQTSTIRAGAHSDYGSLTLLFRLPSQSGLEILTTSNTWMPVPVLPNGTENDPFPPILVNIGDLLSYWTNGLLKSTMHRVVFPSKEEAEDRYSMAYFFHPCKDTKLVSVPSEMVTARGKAGNQGQVLTAMEHLKGRLAATYGWGTEEQKV